MSHPDAVHDCVVAGGPNGTDTHYLRAGRGAPVLLLANDAAVAALMGGLPRRLRCIAPRLASPVDAASWAPEFMPWLRRFLDALGLPRVAIVVGPCFAAHVLGFSLLDPERVDRIVFLLGNCRDLSNADDEQGITERLERSDIPVLVAPFDPNVEGASERTLAEIASFLVVEKTAR